MSDGRPAPARRAREGESADEPTGLPPGFPISFDVRLVEEAVLLRIRELPVAGQAAFRSERDRIYEMRDDGEREAAFGALHGRWFRDLELGAPFLPALADHATLFGRTAGCRAYLAASGRDEHADLLLPAAGEPGEGTLVVRIRPISLLEADRVREFLDVEFRHVADMLEPGFGYQPALPASAHGPSFDNLLQSRYRAVWDVTVEGRLRRGGRPVAARARSAFLRAFRGLGDQAEAAFRRWYDEERPTHQAILAFVRDPGGAAGLSPWEGSPPATAGRG